MGVDIIGVGASTGAVIVNFVFGLRVIFNFVFGLRAVPGVVFGVIFTVFIIFIVIVFIGWGGFGLGHRFCIRAACSGAGNSGSYWGNLGKSGGGRSQAFRGGNRNSTRVKC